MARGSGMVGFPAQLVEEAVVEGHALREGGLKEHLHREERGLWRIERRPYPPLRPSTHHQKYHLGLT